MLEIKITMSEPEPLVMPTVVVNQTPDEGAVKRAFRDGIKEGKSQFAAELKEYIYRNYGSEKGTVGATASHITDMIDALNYGYCGWGPIPKEDHAVKRGGPDG